MFVKFFNRVLSKPVDDGEFGGGSGGSGGADSGIGFDMASAVDSISEGLGFLDDDNGPDDESAEEKSSRMKSADKNREADTTALEKKVDETVAKTEPVQEEKPQTTQQQKPAFSKETAPSSWRKEAQEAWAALPENVREEVAKRESDMYSGLEQYKGNAAVGKTFMQVLNPYIDIMRQHNVDPAQHAANLFSTHHALITGSQAQRVQLLSKIASDYGIDLKGLSQGSGAADDAPGSYVDPAVGALQEEIALLKSGLYQQQNYQRGQVLQSLEAHVQAFASRPENLYFNELADDIGNLLRKGVCTTVEDAYEKAVWMNPVTKAKEIERQQAAAIEQAKKTQEQAAKKLKESQQLNPRSRTRDSRPTDPLGSMDDTMAEAYKKITGTS